MRITANKGNDHWATMFAVCPSVYVDGVQQADVIEADDVGGYIVRLKRDENGRPMVIGDELAAERVSGIVEIFGQKIA